MLDNFPLGLCRVYFSATQDTALPLREHPGALIRDWFGSALKHSVCPFPNRECRDECRLPGGCAYPRLFQPTRAVVGAGGRTGGGIPRPFIIEPPLDEKNRYARGEMLSFNLLLIGTALTLFPFAAAALQETARFGLEHKAPTRSTWRVERIVQISHSDSPDGTVLFSAASPTLQGPLPAKPWSEIVGESEQLPTDRLTLSLRTPLRLINDKRPVQQMDTGSLVHALLRRVSWLSELWCGTPLALDYNAQISDWCGRVECQGQDLVWEEWKRHSTRRDADLKVGGLRGEIVLRGDLTGLRLWLKLGEYLHLGKDTVLGMGKYVCR